MIPVAPNRLPWPPIILAATLVTALTLGHVAPPANLPRSAPVFGLALIAAGLALDVWAMVEMRRHRANILPHRSATALVTTGPFVWSRNPIYLGNSLLLAGLGCVLNEAWLLVLTPGSMILIQRLAIIREERHLAALFDPEWQIYKQAVRRWLGRQ